MKKLAVFALAPVAALALAACGHSDSAKEEQQPENVEMPAEEAVGGVDATPVADASANAVEEGAASDAAPAETAPVRK
ncbi:MAG: hypothetical protein KGM49_10735 [Sphingomonadales bacterium]|nr:hypothetical protein [Sphingomonadales bacterium]